MKNEELFDRIIIENDDICNNIASWYCENKEYILSHGFKNGIGFDNGIIECRHSDLDSVSKIVFDKISEDAYKLVFTMILHDDANLFHELVINVNTLEVISSKNLFDKSFLKKKSTIKQMKADVLLDSMISKVDDTMRDTFIAVMALNLYATDICVLDEKQDKPLNRHEAKSIRRTKDKKLSFVRRTYIYNDNAVKPVLVHTPHKSPEYAFNVKGHYRHLKSGKVVYVKPFVKCKDKPIKNHAYYIPDHNYSI